MQGLNVHDWAPFVTQGAGVEIRSLAAKKDRPMQRAGFPIARERGGTSFVTTLPAEITDPEPTRTPGAITAPCAIHTSSPMVMGPLAPSCVSAMRTMEAIKQRSPTVTDQWASMDAA